MNLLSRKFNRKLNSTKKFKVKMIIQMKTLENNQFFMCLLGISSKRLTEPTNEFLKSINSYVILFGLAGLMFTCSFASTIIYIDNITLALRTVVLIIGSAQCLGSFICIGLKMKEVKQIFITIQEHVDNSKHCLISFNLI